MEDLSRLQEIITYLEDDPKVTYNPYPEYDGRIEELLLSLGTDESYMMNHDSLFDKDINEMNLDEIKTMYTFIHRGERFCDGHIASYLDDGTILKLAYRQLELLNK